MFRPEVQALRAFAVLSVVAYHLYPNRLTGGYVGVDVFFVISGFLITTHLHGEVVRDGRVRLGRFWARRIRRLVPAASVVLLASLLATVAFVPHALWQRSVTEIGASALYVQNWVLAASSVDYLGADNTPTLVQHYWSLSVEEQFYLAWPLLILGALALRRRGAIVAVLAVVFVGSLALSVTDSAASSYFATTTRAWEFAAGGLLAFVPVDLPRRVAAAASWVGVALLVGTITLFTPATPFPSGWALIPVIGTVLVIAARGQGVTVFARLRPVQFVGDISYSLYLWHWPLVVVVPYVTARELTTFDKLAIVVASVLLAVLTKRFVEDPVRRAPRLAPVSRSYLLAIVTIGVVVVASSSVWTVVQSQSRAYASVVASEQTGSCFGAQAMVDSCPRPFAVPSGFDAAFWAADKGTLGTCNSPTTTVVECSYGDLADPVHTVALVGNSHAGHLVAAFDAYGAAHHWKIVLMRKTGCTGAATELDVASMKQPCIDWSKNVSARITDPSEGFDAVVFASNNDAVHYVADGSLDAGQKAAVVTGISMNLAALEAAGKSVVVLGDVPGAIPEVVPECVDESASSYDPCATPRQRGEENDDLVAQAARQTAGVSWIDLMPYFCDATLCHVVIGDALVYIDEHHLTATFSRSLGDSLGAAVASHLSEIQD